MTDSFKGISEKEYCELQESIILITILISGADGAIQKKEREWAEKVTRIRAFNLPEGLRKFYVDRDWEFRETLEKRILELPNEVEERETMIVESLSRLNSIFAKIEDRKVARDLYTSLVTFAEHVARSSGGFLGWGGIGPKESELMKLPMIDPV